MYLVSTAKEIQTIKEQNRKLSESKEETEEAFVLLKTRYDELKNLNFKHVEVCTALQYHYNPRLLHHLKNQRHPTDPSHALCCLFLCFVERRHPKKGGRNAQAGL